jgi:4-amino-4-deoxychorismate lyase
MTGQPGVVVTLDGEVHPSGTPLLFADDLAAVRGDGVFETLLVRAGGACLVEAHLGRLSHSAKLLDLPEPDLAGWRHAIDLAARRAPPMRVRCVWSTAAAGNAGRRPPHT